MQKGRLFIVSGPSGSGKSSICERLYGKENFKASVSMTTRERRGKEVPGVSYYYVTCEEFQRMIEKGEFLEYAEVYGHRYGTPKAPVLKNLAEGYDVILEIEMQGALQAKAAYPEAVTIFILPPSMKALRERLIKRGTEDEDEIRFRIRESLGEIRKIKDYEYYIINDGLDRSVKELKAIAMAKRCRVPENADSIIKRYEEEEDAALSSDR